MAVVLKNSFGVVHRYLWKVYLSPSADVEQSAEPDAVGQGVPLALSTNDIVHHYALLTTTTVNAGGKVQEKPRDCRSLPAPLR